MNWFGPKSGNISIEGNSEIFVVVKPMEIRNPNFFQVLYLLMCGYFIA